jgi:hypothetical protein
MALRLLPFRQYDEQDVVNLFALSTSDALDSTTGDGVGSNGVFVKVTNGNFDSDVISYGTDDYLGKADYPFVGSSAYPTNPLTIGATTTLDEKGSILGITLNQTAKNDENGEKLLYNSTKKEELQAVLPGQTVPVATKGIFTLSSAAFDGAITDFTLGQGFSLTANGKITGANHGATGVNGGTATIGTVLGTGSRASQGGLTDQFAGNYVIVKID